MVSSWRAEVDDHVGAGVVDPAGKIADVVEPGEAVELDLVLAVLEVGDRVLAAAEDEGVAPRAAGHLVVAVAALEEVPAGAAVELEPDHAVETVAADDRVVAAPPLTSRTSVVPMSRLKGTRFTRSKSTRAPTAWMVKLSAAVSEPLTTVVS